MVWLTTRALVALALLVAAGVWVGCGSGDAAPSDTRAVVAPATVASTHVRTQTAKPAPKRTAPSRERQHGPLEFATTPLVLFAQLQAFSRNYRISIVFRMRRLLPERSRRDVRATVLVGDAGSMFPLGRFPRRQPCYEQEFEDAPPGSPLESPRDGQRVIVTVRIKRQPTKVTIPARLRRVSPRRVRDPTVKDEASVGCQRDPPD